MQKLLIVLAIQFCLPLLAALISKFVPIHMGLILSTSTVIINTGCLGCALGLMWPRWRWIFSTCLLTLIYWWIWFADFRFYVRDVPVNHAVWYLKVVGSTAILACSMTLLLMFRRMLVWQQANLPNTAPTALSFSLRDILYYTGVLGLVVGLLSAMYHESSFDLLGDYFAPRDLWGVALTMLLFFHLLQRSITWLSLALFSFSMLLLYLAINPIHEGYTVASYFGVYYFDALSLLLSMLTVLLYRYAGFRIVPRRELTFMKSAEAISCKNC